ncbi:hypothetical protein BTN49_3153 [Candidatus Enterovibrio escicola]|uniref:Mobile element protein n=1 Tax=Candidatus Enterovibrio escicola TaxID=1927127 RepID=A0A2A5SZD8_9GAMM|nr:hypothetical protein BTN49_3153 [Candidatus Enterovibrio escacola]
MVNFLYAAQLNYNTQVGGELANVKAMNKVIRLGMPARQQAN